MFDIVMPIHKMNPQYLKKALSSVRGQKFTEYRCLIIDGTPDDWRRQGESLNVIESFTSKDDRFEYHWHPNLDKPWIGSAVNYGASLGDNPYFMMLAGDDSIYPGLLQKMNEGVQIADDEIGIWFCIVESLKEEYKRVGGHNICLGYKQYYNEYDFHFCVAHEHQKYFHYGIGMMFNGVMFKKDSFFDVGGLDESMVICEDTDLVMRMVKAGHYTKYLPFIGAYYRQHSGQTTTTGEVPFERQKEFDRCYHTYDANHRDCDLLKHPIDTEGLDGAYYSRLIECNQKTKHLLLRSIVTTQSVVDDEYVILNTY